MDDLLANVSTFSPDCVAVTETWLNSTVDNDFISIPGYDTLRCDREKQRGGGVSLWVRSKLR